MPTVVSFPFCTSQVDLETTNDREISYPNVHIRVDEEHSEVN